MRTQRAGVKVSAKPWDRGSRGWWVRIYADGKKAHRKVGPPGAVGEEKAAEVCRQINARNERNEIWSASPLGPLPVAGLVEGWLSTHAPLLAKRTRATKVDLRMKAVMTTCGLLCVTSP